MKITAKLAYLLGAFKDGSIYRNEKEGIYRIRIYQKCKEWLLIVQQIFFEVFQIKLHLRKDPRKELWYLEINNKKLFKFLFPLLSEPVPANLRNASLEIKQAFVGGVFDAEGGVMKIEDYMNNPEKIKKKLRDIRLRFGHTQKGLLQFIKEVLEEAKIACGQVCGPYYKSKNSKGYYELNSYGINNLKKFFRIIGSKHPVKIKRIIIITSLVGR